MNNPNFNKILADALVKQNKITNADCISRKDAISRFSDLLMLELEGKRLPTWEEVYNAMQDVPSAQPKREKGRWIEEPNCWYRCSKCGKHYPSMRGYLDDNFCRNCGAEMKGENDG